MPVCRERHGRRAAQRDVDTRAARVCLSPSHPIRSARHLQPRAPLTGTGDTGCKCMAPRRAPKSPDPDYPPKGGAEKHSALKIQPRAYGKTLVGGHPVCSGREGRCWQLGSPRKFTATSRVVKGKINTTDTRGAECGLGTAIQAHCSDQVPAELMALTARQDENERERGRGGGGEEDERGRPVSVSVPLPFCRAPPAVC